MLNKLFTDDGASFSDCRQYRYALWRIWDTQKPLVMFIGLNPSTANEYEPDPTITRVRGFASDWGFGGVFMMNLHCYVTAYPEELKLEDPLHASVNDLWLQDVAKKCQTIVFAWGNFKIANRRANEVKSMFPGSYALMINKNGSPRHPLYVKGDVTLKKFN